LIFDFPFGTIVQPLWPRRATQAALVLHSLQLITLFSCVYCFFAVSCRQSSSSTGALLFPVAPDPRPPVPRSPLSSDPGRPPPGQQFIMQQRTPKAVWIGRSAGKQTAPDNEFLVCAAFISPLICALAMFAVIANFRVWQLTSSQSREPPFVPLPAVHGLCSPTAGSMSVGFGLSRRTLRRCLTHSVFA